MIKKLLFLLVFIFSLNVNAQYYKLSNNAKVSILTCGSGNELYSIYGHTAIRFQDENNQIDIVFNYGNFDFATDNFYLKFVKGDLQYFVAACSYQDFMYEYIETNRQVWEQNLILDLNQKQKLFEEINTSMFSDERFYTYKFIDKNCTTMVLDKVNGVFGSKIVNKKPTTTSYRTILYSFLESNHFWENFGINIIFGHKVDNKASKLFLPEELMQNLDQSKFNGKKIVEKAAVLNKKTAEKAIFSFWNSIYPYLFLLILIAIINNKKVNNIYFTTIGLIGVFFSTVFIYSQHEEIYWNYNILLFNPGLLFLIYFMIQKNQKLLKKLCYFNLICLGIYTLMLLNKAHLMMMIPMILCSLVLIIRLLVQEKLLTTIK